MVDAIVARFARRLPSSVRRDDLRGAAMLGLVLALREGRHSNDESFAGYVRIRVRGAIVDELRRADWSPRRRKDADPALGTVVVGFDDLPVTRAANLAAEGASPLETLEAKQARRLVAQGLQLLPERERELLRLRYFECLPAKDIANLMGVSEARISQLHVRAMRRLKEHLACQDATRAPEAA
jgi:RNA polymerase sigma factor for flagellar operon FliA